MVGGVSNNGPEMQSKRNGTVAGWCTPNAHFQNHLDGEDMPPIPKVLVRVLILCLAICSSGHAYALAQDQTPTVWPEAQRASTEGHWGDQGNNSFVNPVLPGDFSDLDVIRVGKKFFAISSTMQYSPGVAILQSSDLVNWHIVGHVVSDISAIDPELGWRRMNRAGRGVWAGSIHYHAKQLWVYFGTPDGGIYVSKAAKATGPWSPPRLVIAQPGWDDPCPFWDDDGKGYLVATRFAPDKDGEQYRIHLFAITRTGTGIVPSSDHIIHQSQGSEANKMYKIGGVYLHYFSEVRPEGRVAMMERSQSLNGPWEIRQLNHVNATVDKEPNQGGIIELEDGSWRFLSNQGTGDWEGRAGVLLPVTWIDGWPVLGKPGEDGIGDMVWGGVKPIPSKSTSDLFVSDKFSDRFLKPAWEWRYQPRADSWSLIGGGLRLSALQPLADAGFDGVRNVLTQRSARAIHAEVTVKVNLAGLTEGDEVGLAHFAKTDARIAIIQSANVRQLVRIDGDHRTFQRSFSVNSVWLRSTWGIDGLAKFAYSLDGATFIELGSPYQMTWGAYRGDRIGLYTFAASSKKGYATFSNFTYTVER